LTIPVVPGFQQRYGAAMDCYGPHSRQARTLFSGIIAHSG
jgi:hypothetical protein